MFTKIRINVINNIIENHPRINRMRVKMINFLFGHIRKSIHRKVLFKLLNKNELQDVIAFINKAYVKRCHQESNNPNSTFFD